MPKVPKGMPGKDGRVGLTVRLPPVLYREIVARSKMNDRSITSEAVHLLKAAVQYEEITGPRPSLGAPPEAKTMVVAEKS